MWSNGNTSATLIGLCSGVYSVIISDSVGCTIEDTVFMGVITGCTDSTALIMIQQLLMMMVLVLYVFMVVWIL